MTGEERHKEYVWLVREVHTLSRSSLEPGLKAISTQRMWVDREVIRHRL